MKSENKTEKIKYKHIKEPRDLYIVSNNDDLFLHSKKSVELFKNILFFDIDLLS
jgi:hypothetical protein